MKILLLAAMNKEIDLLLNILEKPIETNFSGMKYWKGNIGQNEIFITTCGIGKVNSALKTYCFIKYISPDLVINSGVAGGAGLPIGSIVIANSVCYHDVWCGPGTKYGQADGFPLFFKPSEKILEIKVDKKEDSKIVYGLVCSGDKFISTSEELNFIRQNFPEVKAVDMESASIAQTCMLCSIEFSIIRIISDTPGEGENIAQYENFWTLAPQKSFIVIKQILENLK